MIRASPTVDNRTVGIPGRGAFETLMELKGEVGGL